jgi:hypothetical protein
MAGAATGALEDKKHGIVLQEMLSAPFLPRCCGTAFRKGSTEMNILMSTTRLAFIAMIVTSSISIGAQSTASGPKQNSISISLKMKEQQVPIGQSPWAILSVKNLTDESIIIHNYMYRVHVEGDKGEPPTTLVQRAMTGRYKPGDEPLRADENAAWYIAPETSDENKIQLAYLYDLSAPGEYSVYAEVMDPSSQKWLRTNTVKFTVQAPTRKKGDSQN